MEWVETTGRSITEAMDAALDQLGVDEQEAEIQILEEPQKGLFGRLRAEARVRARVRPTAPRAKVDRRDRQRRSGRDRQRRKGGRQSSGVGTNKSSAQATVVKNDGRRTGGSASDKAGETRSQDGPSSAQRGGQRRRRRGSGTGTGTQGREGAKVSKMEATETSTTMDIAAQRAAVDEFLTGLLTAFGRPEVEVSTEERDGTTIVAEVNGDELGLLVGPKGQTLQALHELTRSMVQRRFVGETHARVHLDVAGYRQRRTEALERFARSVAEDVLSTGQTKALEPMSSSDRKVVHDVVNIIDGVDTISEGEEPYRRVVIQKS